MNGLKLCEDYFQEYGLKMLENQFSSCKNRIAAGLAGEGSECYGFDDEISKDHDWGPGFCIWLTEKDFEEYGDWLTAAYNDLPDEYQGFKRIPRNPHTYQRMGVFSLEGFMLQHTGLPRVPARLEEWCQVSEEKLSLVTNGKIFYDPTGEVVRLRQSYKRNYPEDLRKKRIAAACMTIGQSGQYNYLRCIRRGETAAAFMALSKFTDGVLSLTFLLNKEFKPFYKWSHRAVKDLPVLGVSVYEGLKDILETVNLRGQADSFSTIDKIEALSRMLVEELRRQGYTDSSNGFLFDHGPVINMKIENEWLRRLNIMEG